MPDVRFRKLQDKVFGHTEDFYVFWILDLVKTGSKSLSTDENFVVLGIKGPKSLFQELIFHFLGHRIEFVCAQIPWFT